MENVFSVTVYLILILRLKYVSYVHRLLFIALNVLILEVDLSVRNAMKIMNWMVFMNVSLVILINIITFQIEVVINVVLIVRAVIQILNAKHVMMSMVIMSNWLEHNAF